MQIWIQINKYLVNCIFKKICCPSSRYYIPMDYQNIEYSRHWIPVQLWGIPFFGQSDYVLHSISTSVKNQNKQDFRFSYDHIPEIETCFLKKWIFYITKGNILILALFLVLQIIFTKTYCTAQLLEASCTSFGTNTVTD